MILSEVCKFYTAQLQDIFKGTWKVAMHCTPGFTFLEDCCVNAVHITKCI